MPSQETIHILGSGAIGFVLAAHLAEAGRSVLAVRTSREDVLRSTVTLNVQSGDRPVRLEIDTVSLAKLANINGPMVVAVKSYANAALAAALRGMNARGPLIIMQNGVGVERPFVQAGFAPIYRCVVYVTSQATAEHEYRFRPVTSSSMGVIAAGEPDLAHCVDLVNTPGFPFHAEDGIEREVWKKAVLNSVFNSICPLLEVDNGVFVRDPSVMALARELVRECVALTDRLGLGLTEDEFMQQLRLISSRSDGQLISTLQDIRLGRRTEIECLNLEMARVAASLQPPLLLPRAEVLGRMILAKSTQRLQQP